MIEQSKKEQPAESVLSAADRGRLADWDPAPPPRLAGRP
jgi:hypothetical protein